MASSISNSNERRSSLRLSSRQQNHKLNTENTENGSTEVKSNGPESIKSEDATTQPDHEGNVLPTSGIIGTNNEVVKNATKSASKRKKVVSRLKSQRYPLRSSVGNGRVLRSLSKETCKNQPESVNTPVNPVTKHKKKRGNVKKDSKDEFSVIRKRVRYLLTRMNYEQSFIDAYSGEGWRGQSAEKIRPEKELERAKSEILRCKFKIRETFRHIDSLSSEGRFEESLFDSEGEIDNEDIFCCKCGSKDLPADNDIVLCDGICDRGFHQKCLNPPLLSEDIPLGDEGWLCPACDCKVDCLELLNEFQGSNISIDDTWEKVFPEAVAAANGDKQYDDLPSDDSEDHDYNPDVLEADAEDDKEGSNPGESESTSASEEDSDASDSNKSNENLGLPSDDSGDDDYDPDAPILEKTNPIDGSSSDESDFTSDSDEFCNELSKTSGVTEDSASSLQNLKPIVQSGEGMLPGDIKNYEHPLLEADLSQENVLVSGQRQLERLDYKKLYDETYEKSSSDSSDDEDWSGSADMSTPNKGNEHVLREISHEPYGTEHSQPSHVDESTPRNIHTGLGASGMEHDSAERDHSQQKPVSNGNKNSTSGNRRLGEIATQKLHGCFQESLYPTTEKKESLAQELGLTFRQVNKWFVNARHSLRVSNKESSPNVIPSPNIDIGASNIKSTKSKNELDGSASKGAKRKKSLAAKQPKFGVDDNAESMNSVEDRQKALARELRKIKQRR